MRSVVWLVLIGIAAVVIAFPAMLLAPRPYNSILFFVLAGCGIWAVGRAYTIHKRQRDSSH